MTVTRGHRFLQTPGPTPVPERITLAMSRQPIDYSGPRFMELATGCLDDLPQLFRTENQVFIYAANGHGAWEAALANTLSPGDRVLGPECGVFALSWAEMAEALGAKAEIVPNDWRHAFDLEAVRARLEADRAHEIKAVLAVQTDTATSVTSDIAGLRRVMDSVGHPALLMVDTIASLCTTEYRMDDWGVDVTVAAAQKGLMMPPGLSFTAVGPKAMAVAEQAAIPRRYWDWKVRADTDHFYRRFCGTAAETLIFGLRETIDMIMEEGLDAVAERHARIAAAVHAAVDVWSRGGAVELNVLEPADRANAVTTIRVAEEVDAHEIRRLCRDRFDVSLGGGLGKMDGQAFRIGHMGWVNEGHDPGCPGCRGADLQGLGGAPRSRRSGGRGRKPGPVRKRAAPHRGGVKAPRVRVRCILVDGDLLAEEVRGRVHGIALHPA